MQRTYHDAHAIGLIRAAHPSHPTNSTYPTQQAAHQAAHPTHQAAHSTHQAAHQATHPIRQAAHSTHQATHSTHQAAHSTHQATCQSGNVESPVERLGAAGREETVKGDIIMQNRKVIEIRVPHIPSLDALLTFLHDHEESRLHCVLASNWDNGSCDGVRWLLGFTANVGTLGILNDSLRGVVWSIVEP